MSVIAKTATWFERLAVATKDGAQGPADRIFVDFEASGIHPDSYPVEIGIVGPDFEFEALIQPVRYWTYWSHDAQDMHGITRYLIESQGVSPIKLCQQLNDRFSGQVLWSNSHYDALWVDILFEAAGIQPEFEIKDIMAEVDVLRLPDYHSGGNDALEHRALSDARNIRACWLAYLSPAHPMG